MDSTSSILETINNCINMPEDKFNELKFNSNPHALDLNYVESSDDDDDDDVVTPKETSTPPGGASTSKKARGKKKKKKSARTVHSCHFCNYTSTKRVLYERHVKIHIVNKPFQCPHCDRSFRDQLQLTNHINVHLGNKPFKCPDCDLAFTTRGELTRHTRYKHTLEKPHKCPQCEYASVELSKLKRHMRTHTGERPYLCPHCDYASRDTFKLKRHIRIHTGEKPYECPICKSCFSQSNSLKAHLSTHRTGTGTVASSSTTKMDIDNSNFKCNYYSSTLAIATNNGLSNHEFNNLNKANLDHDQDQTTINQEESDSAKPKTNGGNNIPNGETHSTSDNASTSNGTAAADGGDVTWFTCEQCNMRFCNMEIFKNHKAKHTGERLFECSLCGIGFAHQFALRAHLNSHENPVIKKKPANKTEESNGVNEVSVNGESIEKSATGELAITESQLLECGKLEPLSQQVVDFPLNNAANSQSVTESQASFKCENSTQDIQNVVDTQSNQNGVENDGCEKGNHVENDVNHDSAGTNGHSALETDTSMNTTREFVVENNAANESGAKLVSIDQENEKKNQVAKINIENGVSVTNQSEKNELCENSGEKVAVNGEARIKKNASSNELNGTTTTSNDVSMNDDDSVNKSVEIIVTQETSKQNGLVSTTTIIQTEKTSEVTNAACNGQNSQTTIVQKKSKLFELLNGNTTSVSLISEEKTTNDNIIEKKVFESILNVSTDVEDKTFADIHFVSTSSSFKKTSTSPTTDATNIEDDKELTPGKLEESMSCPFCFKSFVTLTNRDRHLKQIHKYSAAYSKSNEDSKQNSFLSQLNETAINVQPSKRKQASPNESETSLTNTSISNLDDSVVTVNGVACDGDRLAPEKINKGSFNFSRNLNFSSVGGDDEGSASQNNKNGGTPAKKPRQSPKKPAKPKTPSPISKAQDEKNKKLVKRSSSHLAPITPKKEEDKPPERATAKKEVKRKGIYYYDEDEAAIYERRPIKIFNDQQIKEKENETSASILKRIASKSKPTEVTQSLPNIELTLAPSTGGKKRPAKSTNNSQPSTQSTTETPPSNGKKRVVKEKPVDKTPEIESQETTKAPPSNHKPAKASPIEKPQKKAIKRPHKFEESDGTDEDIEYEDDKRQPVNGKKRAIEEPSPPEINQRTTNRRQASNKAKLNISNMIMDIQNEEDDDDE